MFDFMDDEGEAEELWCLRGYPFKCPFEEAAQFVDIHDSDDLHKLDEFCQNCPKRLEYELHHRGFTV